MNGSGMPRVRLMHRRIGVESVHHSGLSPAIGIRYGGIDRYGASVADATDEAGLPREQLRALARHPWRP